jgi:hypothetical protein
MMRSLLHSEPYLIKLINEKEWDQIVLHVHAHPEDAVPNYSVNRGFELSALARAARGGATIDTLVALTEASIDQLVRVRHYRQGTVLHEAIRSRSSAETILYFVNAIRKYEKEQIWARRGELKPIELEFKASKHIGSSVFNDDPSIPPSLNNAVSTFTTVFNQTDGLGRTPLHYLIERVSAPNGRGCRDELMNVVKELASAFPPAIGKEDADGLTPLDLALVSAKDANELKEIEVEMRLYMICAILVKEYPMAAFPSVNPAKAAVSIPIGSPMRKYRAMALNILKENTGHMIARSRHILSDSVDGSIKHNPLSRALLHGRHISTIELLLEASKLSQTSWYTGQINDWNDCESKYQSGIDQCCMAIVTRDFEVPLHIAVSMGASSDILKLLISSAHKAAAIPDRCDLTPICWAWIRHVIGQIRTSQRRFIPLNYQQMNNLHTLNLARSVLNDSEQMELNNEEIELWRKLSSLLPAAAASLSRQYLEKRIVSRLETVTMWSPLHAAAFLECPRAAVLLVVAACPEKLKLKDSIGNLPVHYAAARRGYSKSLSVGPTSTPCSISEVSPIYDLLYLYPNGARIANCDFQLPLHIAIEMEKQLHMYTPRKEDDLLTVNRRRISALNHVSKVEIKDNMGESIPLFLSKVEPDTLEVKDGLSGLYPFIQAAAGKHSILNTVYNLLRECPSLV